MPGSASACSKTNCPRRVTKAPLCWLKLESPDPLGVIAAELLTGAASVTPVCPDADNVAAPRRLIARRVHAMHRRLSLLQMWSATAYASGGRSQACACMAYG